MKNTIDIIIDSLSEEDWNKLKLKIETKKTFEKVKISREKTQSSINFADWILKHNLIISKDIDGNSCWSSPYEEGEKYNSLQLYNIYKIGDWDIEDDDEEL